MYRLSLSQFGDLWKTNILMVNIGRTITFEKFIKILFFIAVHNAQISLMQSIYFIIQRMIATHSNEETIVKLQPEENIHITIRFLGVAIYDTNLASATNFLDALWQMFSISF